MKWTKFFLEISLQILILSAIGILGTYLGDYLKAHDFFGDTPREIGYGFDPNFDWGMRHYWYFWTVTILCILQVVRIIITVIVRYEHYEKQK